MDTSPIQTSLHTFEFKHQWVRGERAVLFMILMGVATVASAQLLLEKKVGSCENYFCS